MTKDGPVPSWKRLSFNDCYPREYIFQINISLLDRQYCLSTLSIKTIYHFMIPKMDIFWLTSNNKCQQAFDGEEIGEFGKSTSSIPVCYRDIAIVPLSCPYSAINSTIKYTGIPRRSRVMFLRISANDKSANGETKVNGNARFQTKPTNSYLYYCKTVKCTFVLLLIQSAIRRSRLFRFLFMLQNIWPTKPNNSTISNKE